MGKWPVKVQNVKNNHPKSVTKVVCMTSTLIFLSIKAPKCTEQVKRIENGTLTAFGMKKMASDDL